MPLNKEPDPPSLLPTGDLRLSRRKVERMIEETKATLDALNEKAEDLHRELQALAEQTRAERTRLLQCEGLLAVAVD